MGKISFLVARFILTVLFICPTLTYAEELKPIKLLKPQTGGGKPLMQVLNERKSLREYSDKELPLQVLSNMLWAAWGINRSDSGKRTAPSASNMQEIDVYVSMADGLYLYDAEKIMLQPVHAEDIRALTGTQSFVKDAPVNLVFVADESKMGNRTDEGITFISAADAGFISQNVYLFCASEGLATVVRGLVDRPPLAKAMGLRLDQRIIFSQSVGYPK